LERKQFEIGCYCHPLLTIAASATAEDLELPSRHKPALWVDLANASHSSRSSRRNPTGTAARASLNGTSAQPMNEDDDDDHEAVFAAASDILNSSREITRREAKESRPPIAKKQQQIA